MSSPESATVPLDTLWQQLRSAPVGLSADEAAARLAHHGRNEITEKRRNPVVEFGSYFWAPIPWMVEVALVLSLVVEHWTDAVIIGVLLAMNGLVAYTEEHQAANAIDALKEHLATSARVLRSGAWLSVPVAELVPGDVIRVRLGDVVPADARLIDDVELQVDQSALTGESLPVSRGQGAVLYSGAVLTRGEGDALVYATGQDSFFGRTTALVQSAGTVSHFQRAVMRIADYLIVLAVALVGLTAAVSLLRGNRTLETLEFALVVTIASVPVALARGAVGDDGGGGPSARAPPGGGQSPTGRGGVGRYRRAVLGQDRDTDAESARSGRAVVRSGRRGRRIVGGGSTRRRVPKTRTRSIWQCSTPRRTTPRGPAGWRRSVRSIRSSNAPARSCRLPPATGYRVTKGAPQVVTALCPDGSAVDAANDQVERFAAAGYRSLGRRPDHGRRHLATARRPALGRPTARGFGRHGRSRA